MTNSSTPRTLNNSDCRPLRTVPEVAVELNVAERTVWRMIADGELASRKIRGARRIPDQELDRYRG